MRRLFHWLRKLIRPTPKWRAVLDTNIFVAALIDRQNASGRILALWETGELDLVVSPGTFREMELVLDNHGLLRRGRVKTRLPR
jgi:predicted nucleic acid-binding protein